MSDLILDENKKSWLLATVLGLAVSLLLIFQYWGISVFLTVLLAVYIAWHNKTEAGIAMSWKFYSIAAYMCLLSLVFAVTTVGVIRFWSGVILFVLTMVLNFCEKTFRWPRWFVYAATYFAGSASEYPTYFRHKQKVSRKQVKYFWQIILGLVISLPILIVALTLLSSADAVFSDMSNEFASAVERFVESLDLPDLTKVFWRIVVFLGLAPMAYGMRAYLKKEKEAKAATTVSKLAFIAPLVAGTVLTLLNLVYLIFAYVQIRFLFFGSGDLSFVDYDYASYAREGFFELVALSLLNTLGILFINRFTVPHVFNKLALTVTAICTYVMIASSFYKMYLYESYYGYTQLRLYVYIILAYIVVFMALIALNIWKPDYRVIEWAIVVGLCYFLIISYVNVDKIIVNNNVSRYEETGELDVSYLLDLSEDAAIVLIPYLEANEDLITDGLESKYERYRDDIENPDNERWFFEFNIRHQLALNKIEQ